MTITIEEINQEISDINSMTPSLQTKILQTDLSAHLDEGVTWSDLPTKEECIEVLEAYKLTLESAQERNMNITIKAIKDAHPKPDE